MLKMFNCQLQDDPEMSFDPNGSIIWHCIIIGAIVAIIAIVLMLFVT